jgi:hypothetical protein
MFVTALAVQLNLDKKTVKKKGLNFSLTLDSTPYNDPARKALSVKQFLAQKLITELEHPPYSPDLAPNDFWLFPEIKYALK